MMRSRVSRGLLLPRAAVVAARGLPIDVSLTIVTVYCLELSLEVHVASPGESDGGGRRADGPRRLRRRLVPRGPGDPGAVAARRGAAQRPRRGVLYPRIVGHLAPAPAGRGLVPPPPRDRRRADRRRRCSGSACPAPARPRCRSCSPRIPNVRYLRRWESSQPCPPPSTVQGDDPRIPPERRVVGGQQAPRPDRRPRPDGVPRPDGARLQDAHLPGVRADPVVLRMAGRRRPHVHLRLRAAGAQAAAVGRADAAVAAEDARARAVPRLPRPRVPRRPLRDDPPRSRPT